MPRPNKQSQKATSIRFFARASSQSDLKAYPSVFPSRYAPQGEGTRRSIDLVRSSGKPSFRDGALAPAPESRDSGFDASHRPGMTKSGLLRRFRLRSLSYGGQVASRNDVKSGIRRP